MLRWRHRLSPLAIASRLSMPASTVHAVLVRCQAEPVVAHRYSYRRTRSGATNMTDPGALIHVDVKKLGNIPVGGGWRFVGRAQGSKNRAVTTAGHHAQSFATIPISATHSSTP